MMIALMWECLLWAAKACSCALHTCMSTRTPTHTQMQAHCLWVGAYEYKEGYSQTHPDSLSKAQEHATAFALSVLTDK